jgi:hypothetical protein
MTQREKRLFAAGVVTAIKVWSIQGSNELVLLGLELMRYVGDQASDELMAEIVETFPCLKT